MCIKNSLKNLIKIICNIQNVVFEVNFYKIKQVESIVYH